MRGVWFGGRFWPGIEGAEDDPAAQVAALEASLAAERARVGELESVAAAAAELRAQVDQLTANLATVQAEHEVQREQAERASARAAELEAAHGQAVSHGLDEHRRALIAENAGQIVEELVQGATEEALDASLEAAKVAYQGLLERIRQQLAGERVPAGGGGRGEPNVERMSPLEKIAAGLRK